MYLFYIFLYVLASGVQFMYQQIFINWSSVEQSPTHWSVAFNVVFRSARICVYPLLNLVHLNIDVTAKFQKKTWIDI